MSCAADLLEIRVKALEERVLGRSVAGRVDTNHTIVDQLTQIEDKLKELTAGKERFNNCYEKCRQLDKYLDPEYMDRLMATDSAKLEQILAFEEQLRSEAAALERVDRLATNIDSDHIRSYEKFESRLQKIRVIALQRSQESNKIDDKTKQLIVSYNQWLGTIKQQLSNWDQLLAKLEDQRRRQKSRHATSNLNID